MGPRVSAEPVPLGGTPSAPRIPRFDLASILADGCEWRRRRHRRRRTWDDCRQHLHCSESGNDANPSGDPIGGGRRMSPCPTDAILNRFLADSLTADDGRKVENHLNECANCRRRLDELADVTAVGAALAATAQRDPTPAPGLARAIERLETETTTRVAAAGATDYFSPLPTL